MISGLHFNPKCGGVWPFDFCLVKRISSIIEMRDVSEDRVGEPTIRFVEQHYFPWPMMQRARPTGKGVKSTASRDRPDSVPRMFTFS
jgi:hypothetical protein